LGIGVPLFGSLAKPLRRLKIVLRHTLTFTVHEPQIVLGIAVPLVGSQAIPLQRLCIVLRHAPTIIVHAPEFELGAVVALVGQLAQKPQGGRVVASVVRGGSILQGSCDHWRREATQQQNDGSKGVLKRGLHGLGPSLSCKNTAPAVGSVVAESGRTRWRG
jgi:hypothetical protein